MTTRLALALVLSVLPSAAHAQTIEDAQAALAAGDAARAGTLATAMAEAGTRVGSDLAPVYRVMGIAAAMRGEGDAAREAFTRWLALEPDGRLDRTLSDEIRSPFLEARGFWASQPVRLGATATLRAGGGGFDVAVVDPASMVARVRARWRRGAGAWSDAVRPPAPTLAVDVPGLADGEAIDVSITFLDEMGNRIWHDGSDEAPLHLGASADVTTVVAPDVMPPSIPAPDATGFHVGAVVAGVVAVGALIGAAVLHADRERLAGVYNGDGTGCTGTGSTRGEVCGPQRSTIGGDEIGAGVLYGVGGAAAVIAVVLAIAAPSGSPASEHALSCGPGPGAIGIACGGAF